MAARAGGGDLARLAARLGADFVRRRSTFDPGSVVCQWAREITKGDDSRDVTISLLGRHVKLIARRARSEQVLSSLPALGGYTAGKSKVSAMSFLAPRALTIADGDAWHQLRSFNEQVVGTGRSHPFAHDFLQHVRDAFANPVADVSDIRAAMGRAMGQIVLGNKANGDVDPAEDVRILFGVVQKPVRRKLLGFSYRGRRKRLYDLLNRRLEDARDDEHSLLARARAAAPVGLDREGLLQQIPHWMFTFTGSGTDLLARTLMLVTSRPGVHRRVLEEIDGAGPAADAETINKLPYLNACLLETGRLFPPVTRTFHHDGRPAARGGEELVHYFPLLQRDDALGPTVHSFQPERWLAPELDAAAKASNLFLRGPRACPGMDLILFVCRAAIARQLGELRLTGRSERLSRDPLPISFPEKNPRFTVAQEIARGAGDFKQREAAQ
jgi:cytochrome P450